MLALRAADWVPQVRDRARLACRHRLAAPAALPELGRVAFTLEEREGGRWLADELRALLRDGPREFLLAGLTAPDHRTRRIAHQAGRETGRLGPRRLLEAALRDPDLPTRVACADEVIRRARDAGDLGPVRRLRASRTAAIRAAAVHTLALAGDREPSALLDRSPLVRATAQAAERRAGTDPATRYRAALADRPTAVAGLGETGTAADRALLRPLLADPTARVRFEAVRALRRLGDESDLAYLLTDPSPAVVRQVVTHQRPRAATLDESLLRDLLAPTHPAHVRRAAVLLLREHDPWCRLAHDLRLVDDQDVELRGHARTDIGSWLSTAATTYSQPNPARRAELLDLLTRAAPVLDPRTTTALRFHIG
ncbi:HEAT repeat domain-containing protein [Saccharothrix sp. SC076]|nr:HEAT repeat domain-containing protein [Saccharothrix obliqua]